MTTFEKRVISFMFLISGFMLANAWSLIQIKAQNREHFKALQQQIKSATVVDTIRIETPQSTASQYGVQPYTNKSIGHDHRANHTTGHH